MSGFQIAVLAAASVLVAVGLVSIAGKETTAAPWRDQRPRLRQIVEVALPLLGTVILLGALWAAVR